MTCPQLRQDLLTFGPPGLFNDTDLPNTATINGVSRFWISSSVGALFGFFTPPGVVDGFVGIGTLFQAGAERVSAFLHEMGHALGRVPENLTFNGQTYFSELDLVRFTAPGVRLFDGSPQNHTFSYFSLDGGATQIAQWGQNSDSSDFRNGFPFANDPFGHSRPAHQPGYPGHRGTRVHASDSQSGSKRWLISLRRLRPRPEL